MKKTAALLVIISLYACSSKPECDCVALKNTVTELNRVIDTLQAELVGYKYDPKNTKIKKPITILMYGNG
jgi:hypothetical protein